jgi:hypothetical protein
MLRKHQTFCHPYFIITLTKQKNQEIKKGAQLLNFAMSASRQRLIKIVLIALA